MELFQALQAIPKVHVVFPEWVYASLLAKPRFDLLSLEEELAAHVDIIVLPIEGHGTIAELGAFASMSDVRPKMLVLNKEEFRQQQSFITLGPLKLIAKERPENVLYYRTHERTKIVTKVSTRVKKMQKRTPKGDLSNIFNLSRFMLFVVALFQPITAREMSEMLTKWNSNIKRYHVGPSLEILKEQSYVDSHHAGEEPVYELSPSGYREIHQGLLQHLHQVNALCRLRSEAMGPRLKRKWDFDVGRERERLLVR